MDERDRSQGKAATTDATDKKAADATGSSGGDAATEKEAVKRRLGELHRLPNSRKGSLNATCRKHAEANYKACDLNQKSIQALDALANEYVDFEVTMANVTHEQQAGDTLYVATLEVAEELERTVKEQGVVIEGLGRGAKGRKMLAPIGGTDIPGHRDVGGRDPHERKKFDELLKQRHEDRNGKGTQDVPANRPKTCVGTCAQFDGKPPWQP